MVALSPAFFAMAFYESLVHIVLRWNQYLNTAQLPTWHLSWSRTPITLAFGYYLLYVLWVIMSYFLGAYPPWWPFPQPLTAAGAKRPRCPCLPQCVLRLARAVSRTPPVYRTPGATATQPVKPAKPESMDEVLLTGAGHVTRATRDVTSASAGVNPSPDANVQAVSNAEYQCKFRVGDVTVPCRARVGRLQRPAAASMAVEWPVTWLIGNVRPSICRSGHCCTRCPREEGKGELLRSVHERGLHRFLCH